MSKQAFEQKMAQVEALRALPDGEAQTQLRRVLKDRNNYLASRAAAIVAERGFGSLVPDLLDAFERFLRDPVKTDPQCWAKNALAKALKNLGHTEPAVFLKGMAHVQMEPAYLRPVDTAITLRGACGLALAGCALDSFEILMRLTDLLCDNEAPVRVDAARAIAHLSAAEGSLPLRLKARLGDAEPEVVGECLSALLNLNFPANFSFVTGFLNHEEPDLRMEAAGILAGSREPEALGVLIPFFERQADPEVRSTLVTFLAASPQPEAAEYLLAALPDAPDRLAAQIVDALRKSRFAEPYGSRAALLFSERQLMVEKRR